MPQLPPETAIGQPPVRIFDHHIHADGRNADDYELMALSGIDTVLIPCSTSNETRASGASFEARFKRLAVTETRRAAHYGVSAWVALAVHAADIADLGSAMDGVERLAGWLDDPRVLAVGELSLRQFSQAELTVFGEQLRLAQRAGLPAVIELPPRMAGFDRMAAVLRDVLGRCEVDPARVALMDVLPGMLPYLAGLGFGGLGLAVSPAADRLFQVREKLDHQRILAVLEKYGPERLMLNSGFHFGSADPLGLSRTVLRLRLAGVDTATLRKIAWANAASFFRLEPDPAGRLRPALTVTVEV